VWWAFSGGLLKVSGEAVKGVLKIITYIFEKKVKSS